jgi:hypothetical protein
MIAFATETRTQRLRRLLQAWRYDRSLISAEDIGWLLERAQAAQEAGLGVCKECARDVDDPLIRACWTCVRDADFLGGGQYLNTVPMD